MVQEMHSYTKYLEWVSEPKVLAEKIYNDEFGFDEFFYLTNQGFDEYNKCPYLARAIYRASIIGSFNDKFLSRDLLKPFTKILRNKCSKYTYHQVMNLFYIEPEALIDRDNDVHSALSIIDKRNIVWLFSNPDAYHITEYFVKNYIKKYDKENIDKNNALKILLDQASVTYSKKTETNQEKKLNFDDFSFDTNINLDTNKFDSIEILDYCRKAAKIILKKPKIAICITGQFRSFEKAAESWLEFLQSDADYDFYVSTWENTGYKSFSWGHLDRILDIDAAEALRVLKRKFQNDINFDRDCESFFHSLGSNPVTNDLIKHGLSRYGPLVSANFFRETDRMFSEMSNAEKMYFHNSIA